MISKEILERSIDTIYPSKEILEKVLAEGKKLKIYLGVDPTGSHLHLGHATNLLVLKRFQKLGHKIIFLIGDFTAQIGDPTDKLSLRQPLTKKQIKENLKTFKKQVGKIISFNRPNPAKVKFNSKWLAKMSFSDLIQLTQHLTVQQMIERDMFQKRLKAGKPIGLHEFLYPLIQGYDSVAMNVDLEIGGTDQTFNMLMGRNLLKIYKNKEKFVITTKLLINPKTGNKLMNKSEGGLINLDDSPNNMFGKVMALSDEVIFTIAEFSTEMPLKKINELKNLVSTDQLNPRDVKLKIANEVVTLYHNQQAAKKAEQEFIRVFSKKGLPEKMPKLRIRNQPAGKASKKLGIIDLLIQAGISSKSEARRLIKQGAVKINDDKKNDSEEILTLKGGEILKIGKRRFFKII